MKAKTIEITDAQAFIDEQQTGIVKNWSNQASLLSYGQVAELMEAYNSDVEKELTDALTYLLACNNTPRFKCELNLAIKKAEDILSGSKSKTK